jgi:hypothetical protein
MDASRIEDIFHSCDEEEMDMGENQVEEEKKEEVEPGNQYDS